MSDTSTAYELTIQEDQHYIVRQAVLYTLTVLALFIVAFIAFDLGHTGFTWAYLVTLAALTAIYFLVAHAGMYIGKAIKPTPVLDATDKEFIYHPRANAQKDVHIAYKDITSYQIVREAHAIRFLLRGSWVKHPSGVFYIGVVYPYQKAQLDQIEADLHALCLHHQIKKFKQK